ncbi:methionine adenosyltransferase domain-containing protein [Siminovitchia fortis]|uniref:methionine adenosyltransferase domain-containing protein n=1 Tax=Siminovitchia fortis TaxID=254758 RepID=UPI0036F31537
MVGGGVGDKWEVEVGYGMGVGEGVWIWVESFGRGKVWEEKVVKGMREKLEVRGGGMMVMVDLGRGI